MAGGAACKWIEVDPKKLNLAREDQSRGSIYIKLYVSPHDVPEAVRGCWDGDAERFVVEFRYLDSEPSKLERGVGPVRLRLGKYSRRINGIEVDTRSLEADEVQLEISSIAQSALERLAAQPSKPHPDQNYRVAKDLVAQLASKLFSETVPPRPSFAH